MTDDVFLLLGTNLGNKAANLESARQHISDYAGKISKLSKIYETAAWGKTDQPSFFNQVIKIQTALAPLDLLGEIHKIERSMGRIRFEKWGERIIDIDILFYGNQTFEHTELQIPHPELQNRRFTLEPLVEIAPDFNHPIFDKTIKILLAECPDKLKVESV